MSFKMHWRQMLLYNNAGMDFPACYSQAELLDLDKSRLPTTGRFEDVTCKRCIKHVHKYYAWILPRR